MSPAIDTAKELLSRTRSISACLDSMVQPHRRVVGLKAELSGEPFAELGRSREVLMTELRSIEELLSKGWVNEACSAISAYEGSVALMVPSLNRLSAVRKGMRAIEADEAPTTELARIEEMVLHRDMVGAESALVALERAGSRSPAGTPAGAPSVIDKGGIKCALCGRAVRADLDLCPYCGWEPDAPTAECPECGGTVLLEFRSCPSCGKDLPARASGGKMVLSSLNIG